MQFRSILVVGGVFAAGAAACSSNSSAGTPKGTGGTSSAGTSAAGTAGVVGGSAGAGAVAGSAGAGAVAGAAGSGAVGGSAGAGAVGGSAGAGATGGSAGAGATGGTTADCMYGIMATNPACDPCGRMNCCTQLTACISDMSATGCFALNTCLSTAMPACLMTAMTQQEAQACVTMTCPNEAGAFNAWLAVQSCLGMNCQTQCT